MSKLEVTVIALSESDSKKGFYVLVLEEKVSKKRIPLIIGLQEAQAIAIHLERLQPVRPLTHDLTKNLVLALGAVVREVFIHQLENDTFYAKISLKNIDNQLLEIDARPSDAIALAIRFNSPIFVSELILEAAGYEIDEKGKEKKGSYAEYSLLELEELLRKILEKEDYESAARVRDAIDRRKI